MAHHVVERSRLVPGSAEYQDVCEVFNRKNTTHSNKLDIVSIEKVTNLSLEQKFKEKQEEYKRTYGQVRIVKVFHGTRAHNVASILKNNFDIRRHGCNVGHRFGAGVSFSSMASYASHYCDKGTSGCMLLCQVLVSNIVQVEENRGGAVLREPPFIPGRYPMRFDTTAKNKDSMDVIVKFEENTFYPAYVVNFKRGPLPARMYFDDEDTDDDPFGTDFDSMSDDGFDNGFDCFDYDEDLDLL